MQLPHDGFDTLYVYGCRGRAMADFTESESELGFVLRRRRRRNRSTETLTYAADGHWDGSQSTLARCARHASGFVLCWMIIPSPSETGHPMGIAVWPVN